MNRRKVDGVFLGIVLALVLLGVFIFSSALLGLLARDEVRFSAIAFNQIFFGVIGGLIALTITSKINYKIWRKYSFFILLTSIFLTLLVFIPGLGFEHGGAKRWISIGSFSLQPAEFLKLGIVIYLASWFSFMRTKVKNIRFVLLPLIGILALAAGLLLKQPDTGTFLVIFLASLAVFITAGGKWKHILSLGGLSLLGLSILAYFRPYIQDRIMTFLDPSRDPLGSAYQIQQSLIAVGSGEFFGRGFGQSIQKFNFLPEPVGDSIFAVAAEEFGFVGALIIISLFVAFAIRGLKIAKHAPDAFSRLLVTGIVILIASQSFINIASMLGIFPLTGLPLLFISQGGTAMLISLAATGVILNVSKYCKF